MCGICAYAHYFLSKSPAEMVNILIAGLRRLEYRGYDSAGLCIPQNDTSTIVRQVGNVTQLQAAVSEVSFSCEPVDSGCGIAHTRWATHGNVSDANAHPQSSDEGNAFVVVHNGIMTNHEETRKFLQSRGYHFRSETDTEVVACLAKYLYDNQVDKGTRPSFEQLIDEVMTIMQGAFALVFQSKHYPGELVACKRGSPLIVGIKHSPDRAKHRSSIPVEYLVASDTGAVVEFTKNVTYIEDDDLVLIRNGVLRFVQRPKVGVMRPELRKVHTLQVTLEQYSKGHYAHFMEKEIFEQPSTVVDCMRGRVNFAACEVKLGGFQDRVELLKSARRFVFISCGTSLHSCLASRPLIDELVKVSTAVENASDFFDRCPKVYRDDVCIFASQSGETADSLRALEYCKQQGALTVGFTNAVGSSIARMTDFGSHLNIGAEIGVASTKAYTAQIVLQVLLALLISADSSSLLKRRHAIVHALAQLPEQIAAMLPSLNTQMRELAQRLKDAKSILILGRGYQYATALEGALKIKELCYIHAEGINSGELKHGPLALIDESMPVIVICTKDSISDRVRVAVQQIRARKGRPITIISASDPEIENVSNDVIRVPETVDCLQCVLNVIPLQLLAFHITVLRGNNVDQPRNLAKSVTVQ